MKRIICTFLSIFLIAPCVANIHINPYVVTKIIAAHFPEKQKECFREYNAQLKASNGAGIAAPKLWNVCTACGLDIKQPIDEKKCKTFVKELISKGIVIYRAACGKDKNISGTVCINDFAALTVNRLQAQGLAKLYARSKSDNIIQCKAEPRTEVITTTPINPRGMGMSSTQHIPYLQCTSLNNNKFYEFKFNNVYGSIDATNHKHFKTGICQTFGYKYASKKPEAPADNHIFDICDGVKDEYTCNKLNQVISTSNIGYIASWGPLDKTGRTGYKITGRSFPYCVLNEMVGYIGYDGYKKFERTAFGLDGRVFLKAGIQRKGSKEIKAQILSYVENTMGKENVKSFSCEDTYHTIKLKDRGGEKDDMLRCTINGSTVEFFFDDLSEAWETYDKSGREAMNCIAWGGTFTGKKCIGLDQKMCYKVRDANAQYCPECKKIQWNNKTKTCELPESVSASNLKKGLKYTAIVGGTIVGVVITIGTLGATSTPTTLIIIGLTAETIGAGIELNEQIKIDAIADEFLLTSQKCKSASCAEILIKQYLQRLSNISSDMLAAERNAVDKELARLVDLLPNDSQLLIDIIGGDSLTDANQKSLFDADSWEPEQIWRAVGITLQMTSIFASVGKWVLKSTGILAKDLPETTIKITSKAKLAREGIIKTGKTVKTTDGRLIVPMGRMAEMVDNTNLLVISAKTKLSYYGQSFDEIYKGFKQGGGYPSWWKVSDLTQDELNALNKYYLAANEYKLMNDGSGNLIFKYIGSGKQSVAQAAERFDDYGRDFLKRFNYNVDARPKTWQDVLQKWDLPPNATDDMIEAKYKAMMEDLKLYDIKGKPYMMSNQIDLIGSVQTDYAKIKKTKPNFANARQTSKTIVSQTLYDAGKTHIDNEQVLARQLGLSIKKDTQLMRYEEDYMNALAKANNNTNVENAWRTYH